MVTSRPRRAATLLLLSLPSVHVRASSAAPLPARPGGHEDVDVVRRLLPIRVDPKVAARSETCKTLRPDDLEVAIDGTDTRVIDVERLPPPTRYWLVFDTSQSAEGRRSSAKDTAIGFVRDLGADPSLDFAVATIDEDLRLLVGPTRDRAKIVSAIGEIWDGGQSFLRDGLDELLRVIASDRREHAILFWTDGDDASSLASPEDLRDTLRRVPNATIFPIVFRSREGTSRPGPPGAFLYDLARDSGGEVFSISESRLAESIRDGLDHRWVVVIAPPEGAEVDAVSIAIPGRRCRVELIREDAERYDRGPIAPPPGWERVTRSRRGGASQATCDPNAVPFGCSLDAASDPGILYEPRAHLRAEILSPASFVTRRWRVDAAERDTRPTSRVAIVDRVAALAPTLRDDDERSHTRHPLLLNGTTFLVDRAKVADAVVAMGDDHRAFALARLSERADRGIERIAARLKDDFPALSVAESVAAARASESGRRLLAAACDPSGDDLGDLLAAWLGDIAARDLFLEWERLALDALLRGSSRPDAVETWREARSWLAIPRRARILAPLVPIRDAERDVVGFWRIVAPRPVRLVYRASGAGEDDAPDDVVPERPHALELVARLLDATPEARERLAAEGWTAGMPRYVSRDRTRRPDAERPYRRVRVEVAFSRASGDAVDLAALLDVRESGPAEVIEVTTDGDPDLARALRESGAALAGVR